MKYLLDTDTCLYIIKNNYKVIENLKKQEPENVAISAITYSELYFGVMNSNHIERNKIALLNFLSCIEILNFDDKCAETYGEIRADLKKRGQIIGSLDLLIASHAKAVNYTLVSNNIKEFSHIKNLKIVNWNI